jgi:hypothetical protein
MKKLDEISTEFYSKLFKQLLESTIKDKKMARDFYGRKLEDQKNIERGIDKISKKMAKKLVNKLKKKGYPQKEIPDKEFKKIVKEILKGFSHV